MRGTQTRVGLVLLGPFLVGAAAMPMAAQTAGPPMAFMHMAFTPARPGTAADTARALDVVEHLRAAIAPYQTLEAAEAAGYRSRKDPEVVKRSEAIARRKANGSPGPIETVRPLGASGAPL